METLTGAATGARPRRGLGGRVLVFVGFMGAGKSSAARTVAAELGTRPLDSDRELESELGESLEAFFDRHGEAAFRVREEAKVLELLARPDAEVIALGGGALSSGRVREALSEHVVVHLRVGAAQAWRRATGKGRPLARDRARFDQLHEDRQGLYDSVADATLSPDGDRGTVRRALPALVALAGAPRGTRLEWASAASGEYGVFLAPGLLTSGFFPLSEGRRFVVTDEHVAAVAPLAGDFTVEGRRALAIPAGEDEKTLGRAEAVLSAMARAGVTRDDLVVAVGGGVVGDLAGFCAAVYGRGIGFVQVPTTLLAQVDSAYGGKTGVDLPEGKNLVGAFHQPRAVLVDPAVLRTLPPAEAAAGYAEVLKTALIAGGSLWARVREGVEPDADIIRACARTKLGVVAEDERDAGRRQVLNLGHTVGHAIEAATGFRYRHGEAVGLGLLCALRLSGRDALRAEVSDLLAARGLPLTFSGAEVDDVLGFAERDKKKTGGRVPFVLVQAPGTVTPGHQVTPADLRAAIAEVLA